MLIPEPRETPVSHHRSTQRRVRLQVWYVRGLLQLALLPLATRQEGPPSRHQLLAVTQPGVTLTANSEEMGSILDK